MRIRSSGPSSPAPRRWPARSRTSARRRRSGSASPAAPSAAPAPPCATRSRRRRCTNLPPRGGEGAKGKAPGFPGAFLVSAAPRSALLRKRSAGLGDDALEGLALVHRDIGEGLAVEVDPGELQTVHELAVGQPLGADGGVDALDPQG